MAKYLSEDLRIRVIEAVEAGASRRRAAARFGVSVSSAIRWVDVWRRTGRTAPYPRGGDRRSGRIEGAAEFLLAKVEETPDITLAELQAFQPASSTTPQTQKESPKPIHSARIVL